MDKNMLYLVCLLNPYTDTDTVDTRLNEDLLIFVPRDCQRIEENFGRACSFHLRDIMSFRGLRCEIW